MKLFSVATWRRAPALVGLGVALLCGMNAASADTYPSKTITMYVPFPPGGTTDTLIRILVKSMAQNLDQNIVVQNLGGAGGTIGMARVAQADPDGYTLLFNNVAQSVAPLMFKAKGLDPIKSFEPVGMVAFVPMMLVSRSGLGPKTLKEVLELSKKKKLSIATSGLGSATQLCALLLMNASHADLMPIAYRGAGPAIIDVVGGRVDLLCDQPTDTASYINTGKMTGYAIASQSRIPILPDVPTFTEQGLPIVMSSWHGIYAPKGTPKAVTEKLSASLQKALLDPELKKAFDQLGAQTVSQQQATPGALRDYLKADIARWTPLVKDAAADSQ